MRLDGALARTGTRCKSTGKGGHRTWLSCFTRLGNSQGSKDVYKRQIHERVLEDPADARGVRTQGRLRRGGQSALDLVQVFQYLSLIHI